MPDELHDYACPTCGFDGPHPVEGFDSSIGEIGEYLIECGSSSCSAEFSVPSGQL